MLDAIVFEFLGKVMRGTDNIIGVICVVYHHSPHFGFGGGIGKIGVFFDSDRVGKIPRMEPVKRRRDKGTETARDDAGHAHVFAAVHHLDGGNFKALAKTKASNRTASFVVDVENIVFL